MSDLHAVACTNVIYSELTHKYTNSQGILFFIVPVHDLYDDALGHYIQWCHTNVILNSFFIFMSEFRTIHTLQRKSAPEFYGSMQSKSDLPVLLNSRK